MSDAVFTRGAVFDGETFDRNIAFLGRVSLPEIFEDEREILHQITILLRVLQDNNRKYEATMASIAELTAAVLAHAERRVRMT